MFDVAKMFIELVSSFYHYHYFDKEMHGKIMTVVNLSV